MEYVYDKENYAINGLIKSWVPEDKIEDGALQQAMNLANLPFAFKHIALMPDCHQGYGMPIGGVLVTNDVIIPNAVGVDIGCGVAACKLPIKEISKDQIKEIFSEVRKIVPFGKNRHKYKQDELYLPDRYELGCHFSHTKTKSLCQNWDEQQKQIGTLGGGNHFIEIQKGSDDHIWIMIHSGSRNLGYKVANYYNKIAKKLNKQWYAEVDPKHDLAFLPIDHQIGIDYLNEMKYCVDFAKANRRLMMERYLNIILQQSFIDESLMLEIHDVPHNYVAIENHFRKNVWVHRKGATKAYKGEIGIIPGSQGTSSYIVKGKGNLDSFKSCSHGAGRTMSRTKAKEKLNLEEEIQKMNDQNIIHGMRNKNNLDEASSAYKDIKEVMKNQEDLVDIIVELKPLGVIKG